MRTSFVVLSVFCVLFLGKVALAGAIHKCAIKTQKCIVLTDAGIVGDWVTIYSYGSETIAKGIIIKKKNQYAIVKITTNFSKKLPEKGFPVTVNIQQRNRKLQWASVFGSW